MKKNPSSGVHYYPLFVWRGILDELKKDPYISESHTKQANALIKKIDAYMDRGEIIDEKNIGLKLEKSADVLLNKHTDRLRRKDQMKKKNPARKKNPTRGSQHWIVKVVDVSGGLSRAQKEVASSYFDGTMTAAKKWFRRDRLIANYWGQPGYVITMQPNAIVLWDGYKKNPKTKKKATRKKNPANKKYFVFKVKGNDVRFLRGFTADKALPRFTLTKGDAAKYTRSGASQIVNSAAYQLPHGWKIGIASANSTIPNILKHIQGKA